jgi:hypothetical protein
MIEEQSVSIIVMLTKTHERINGVIIILYYYRCTHINKKPLKKNLNIIERLKRFKKKDVIFRYPKINFFLATNPILPHISFSYPKFQFSPPKSILFYPKIHSSKIYIILT